MRPDEDDAAFLWDMLSHARLLVRITQGSTREQAEGNETLRLAVERCIEIIGEAARGVSRATQEAHPKIPWKKIVQQRNVIAHEYGVVVFERIWRVATVHVPALVQQLELVVPPDPPDTQADGPDS